MNNENFNPKILNRKRIENELSGMFDVPIFFISASMGYGKTTAVKSFLEKCREFYTIWFDIGSEPNDEIWIWNKFCNRMKVTDPQLSKKLRHYGVPKGIKRIYKVIELLRSEVTHKTVIIIDDWDDKKATYLNNFFKSLALNSIPNLHIVIISRNRPAPEYIELELKQKCIIMQQEALTFTLQETVEFFNINGIELNPEDEKKVFEYTGGWVSATYLSMLQYYNEHNFEDIPKATELIKTAVYSKFDEITKKTLQKLSLIDDFTLEEAIYITGNRKCSKVIKDLISNNCFIKYNNKLKLYTLHSILRTALKEELLTSDIDIYEIYNNCGNWCYKNNDDISAIIYYYKAKNFSRVLDLIEYTHTIALTNLRQTIINPVFDQLTMQEKINRPIAYLTYIFFYILYENVIDGRKLLFHAKEIYEADDQLVNKRAILGEIAFLESLFMFDDVKKMTAYHKKAYELLDGGTSRIANNKMPVTFGSPHFLCLYHTKCGQLKAMVDYFVQASKYFIHISNGGAMGVNYLMKAEYCFETGECQKGKIYAYKALYKANSKKQSSIMICSLFLLVRICIYDNDISEAQKTYNDLIDEYETMNFPRWLNSIDFAKAYINGIMGNPAGIPNNINDIEDYEFEQILPIMTTKYIAQGMAIICQGNFIKLDIHAEIMIQEQKNSIFGLIYAYIFKAISQYNTHNVEKGKKLLLEAIDLARQDHIVACFAELAPHIISMLKELQNVDEYVKEILPECMKFCRQYKKNTAMNHEIELTPRETQVMQLVDKGYKQTEISQMLNIALITVKKHISSVYSKLQVQNKTKALNILKEKGVI
ncbi:helix-turn-helix transcriptional regulator [Clostridium oryzae]|uniref:Response regulator protein VraR n=1 Tax=Clostridium oryzae TaxID=1450648 RepID=A0A1V4ILR2_9CLOT|nr:LuxR C-terminal-related transcriptional regulator [Clostridium oryzae]OPJ60968.1 response regulator protein VraR [Clostridium oryzae]